MPDYYDRTEYFTLLLIHYTENNSKYSLKMREQIRDTSMEHKYKLMLL